MLDPGKVELRRNSEWLDRMTMVDAAELMGKYTVSRMLERKDFAARFAEGRAIHMHEFLYPLLQGYDSVALECDVELGGTDQLFNLLVGRDLMGKYGKRPQIVMTTPILEGTDARIENGQVVGKKMSKSADNYIGIQEPPEAMYRKAMQIGDDVVFRFFELLSSRSNEEIAALKKRRAPTGAIRGRSRRSSHARSSSASTTRRRPSTRRASSSASTPGTRDHSPSRRWSPRSRRPPAPAGVVLARAGFAATTSAANRMITQGGVIIGGELVVDWKKPLEAGKTYVVRFGSKNRQWKEVRVV